MKAYQLEGAGFANLKPTTREIPQIKANHVLIKLASSSLNYHDLVTLMGLNPFLKYPLVPLSDGCGEVVEIGEGVDQFKKGDRAMPIFFQNWQSGEPSKEKFTGITGDTLDGCLQEYICLPQSSLVKAPRYLSNIEAATLPCAGLTAWRSVVVEGKVKAGDTVLLQGTGGVSIYALQFCKMLGATTIITSSSDEKLEKAQRLGADHLINYQSEPKWGKKAKAITDGRGVDHIVEVGGSSTIQQSLGAIRVGGHIGVIGVLSGFADVIPIAKIMALNVTLKGITVGSREHFMDMCRALESNQLKPVIEKVIGFDDCIEGIEYLQSGQHFGKIALDYLD